MLTKKREKLSQKKREKLKHVYTHAQTQITFKGPSFSQKDVDGYTYKKNVKNISPTFHKLKKQKRTLAYNGSGACSPHKIKMAVVRVVGIFYVNTHSPPVIKRKN